MLDDVELPLSTTWVFDTKFWMLNFGAIFAVQHFCYRSNITTIYCFLDTVTSANYPSPYGSLSTDGWTITAPNSSLRIQLIINVLDIECDCYYCPYFSCTTSCDTHCSSCPKDYLVNFLCKTDNKKRALDKKPFDNKDYCHFRYQIGICR